MMTSESFIARRTESLDAERISELISRHTENVFGRTDVEKIIEYANLSITLVGVESGEVLGHMAFMDYPRVATVDQTIWEEWIHTNFQCPKKTSPVNSLFVHLFVAKEGFFQGAAAELLRAAFMTIPLLQYVFLTPPAGTNLGSALSHHLQPLFPCSSEEEQMKEEEEGKERGGGLGLYKTGCAGIDLYMAHRHEHFPMLHVRTARVEDADDLMPIFTQSSTSAVNEQYGEFFLAELIESQDDQHKTIVADVNGIAVGFMSVTSAVDVEHLNASYQLEPFHGFRRPADQDEILSISTAEQQQRTTGTKLSSTTTLLTTSSKSIEVDTESRVDMEEQQQQQQQQQMLGTATTPSNVLDNVASGYSSYTSFQDQAQDGSKSASVEGSQSSTIRQDSARKPSLEEPHVIKEGRGDSITIEDSSVVKSESMTETSRKEHPVTIKLRASSLVSSSPITMDTRSHSLVISAPEVAPVIETVRSDSKTTIGETSAVIKAGDSVDIPLETIDDTSATDIQESTVVTATAVLKIPHKKQYVFRGTGNALAVQLFAIDEKYEMRALDILPMVFQLFPDHDFLVLSQPQSLPEFPLLARFSRVLPRPGVVVPQDLYSLHKCSLLHSFSVRPMTTPDVEDVVKLSSDLRGSSEMVKDVQRYLQAKRDPLSEGSTPISVLVATCYQQVVGVAVLREEEDIRYIRTHFKIEDFIYFDYHPPAKHAHLHHFILNPIFSPYTKHFIKECLRLSYKSCLYYPLYPDFESEPSRPHSIITALSHMVPIKARRQIVYSMERLDINAPLEELLADKPMYALYHTNRKLTFEPKIHVNARVLVVGASDTAISFLETLLFSPHLHFTNLTLLSPHSFTPPTLHSATGGGGHERWQKQQKHHHKHQHPVTSTSMCYTKDQYTLLGLNTWVNTVRGKLVTLDRPEQYVCVQSKDSTCVVHYDYLVLCMGTQYQLPPDLGTQLSRCANIFTVNDAHEKDYLLRWVKNKYLTNPQDNLVIYGNNLDAYAVLQAMLDCGVSPDNLVLTSPGECSICPNPEANDRLMKAVQSTGVTMKSEVCLKKCVVDEGRLVELQFEGKDGKFLMSPEALIYVDKKAVDLESFKALNDACLVMDRKLVITTDHVTNDPLIFAAGPLTKFSRYYRAENWSHANYNSREVGERLADTMLSKLDPIAGYWEEEGDQANEDDDLLPSFTQPKVAGAYLPGGYHYLHIYTPSTEQDLQEKVGKEGLNLTTDTENGYMYLHLDQYGRVDEVVAFSLQPLKEASNYLCLYHVHEKYLNSLVQRWQGGLIPDLYEYFRQPWACAIFHDRFADFMEEVKEHLQTVPLKDGGEEAMDSYVQHLVTEDQARSRVNLSEVLPIFEKSQVKEVIEKKLYKFLIYNANHLPMYVNPDLV